MAKLFGMRGTCASVRSGTGSKELKQNKGELFAENLERKKT